MFCSQEMAGNGSRLSTIADDLYAIIVSPEMSFSLCLRAKIFSTMIALATIDPLIKILSKVKCMGNFSCKYSSVNVEVLAFKKILPFLS